MSLLCDKDLLGLVNGGLIQGVTTLDAQSNRDPIQAASIDLRIGEVFLPGIVDSQDNPVGKKEVVLTEGHTAVVRTKEVLNLKSQYAGICFPPSRVAFKGLLMTNPGHIDPGYKGALRFTVINMGKEPYTLREDDPIATLLIFKLSDEPSSDWLTRNPQQKQPDPALAIKTAMDLLSPDFLNVTKRADQAVKKAALMSTIILTAAAILAPGVFAFVTWLLPDSKRQIENENRIKVLEQMLDVEAVKKRVETLELKAEKTKQSATKDRSAK